MASITSSVFLASVSGLSIGVATADVISTPQKTRETANTDQDHAITATGVANLTTRDGPAVVIDTD